MNIVITIIIISVIIIISIIIFIIVIIIHHIHSLKRWTRSSQPFQPDQWNQDGDSLPLSPSPFDIFSDIFFLGKVSISPQKQNITRGKTDPEQ